MIAGPYSAGGADALRRAANLEAMNAAALKVFEKGHIPVIGVNMALPIIACAGEERFEEIMMPISLALADRSDAILRIGGPSKGADQEVDRFLAADKPIYACVDEIPDLKRKA